MASSKTVPIRQAGLACLLAAGVLIFALSGIASGKSLYVIADINDDPTPVQAYDIQGAALVYQATHPIPSYAGGAVGLAIDTDSETLFVTYEVSNVIQLIDAATFADLGSTTAPGASNLAGIAVDQDALLVYTVDRYTDNLYVYGWDAGTQTLSLEPGFPLDLPNASGLYGIALDEVNDLLYVADGDAADGGRVRAYDTATWNEQRSIKVAHPPIGIAVDAARQAVYTVASFAGSPLLSRYDLAASTEQTVNIGRGGMGVAVDPATGLVYITRGQESDDVDDVCVWDVSPFSEEYSTGDLPGDPTGLCVPGRDVSYNPLGFDKDDGLDEDECVAPGDDVTYELCFDNTLNDFPLYNVSIVDTLPDEVAFVSASDGGSYDAPSHTVTWDIGTLDSGAAKQCLTLVVQVAAETARGSTITNNATISFAMGDQLPIQTTQGETTNICAAPAEQICPTCPDVYETQASGVFCPTAATIMLTSLMAGLSLTQRRRRR